MNAKRTQTIGYLANFRVQTYACLHPPALQDTGHAHTNAHTKYVHAHSHLTAARTHTSPAMKRRKEDDSLKLCRQQNLSYHITHIQACKASVLLSLHHPANSRENGLKRVHDETCSVVKTNPEMEFNTCEIHNNIWRERVSLELEFFWLFITSLKIWLTFKDDNLLQSSFETEKAFILGLWMAQQSDVSTL